MLGFYERIEELIKQKNTSQKDLSVYLELSTPQIFANWKQRGSIPPADTAVKIADFLDTSVEFLVTGQEKNIYKQKYDELRQKADAVITTLKD